MNIRATTLSLCLLWAHANHTFAWENTDVQASQVVKSFMQDDLGCAITNDGKPYYVGELGELWLFPSDHLPIGASLDNFHIAFWNILNKNYLFHIEKSISFCTVTHSWRSKFA